MAGLRRKQRLGDERGKHRGENSWVQTADKSYLPLPLFTLEEVGEEEEPLFVIFNGLLLNTTFPFSDLKRMENSGLQRLPTN